MALSHIYCHKQDPNSLYLVNLLALGVMVPCAWVILRASQTYIKPVNLGRRGMEDRADSL